MLELLLTGVGWPWVFLEFIGLCGSPAVGGYVVRLFLTACVLWVVWVVLGGVSWVFAKFGFIPSDGPLVVECLGFCSLGLRCVVTCLPNAH